MATRSAWGREDDKATAVDRLLDAAGAAFEELGLERTGMDDVARYAACSRGTLYRYFTNRDELRRAYVDREALRLARRVDDHVKRYRDPERLLVEGITFALSEVRGTPSLAAWFRPSAVGVTSVLAGGSEVIYGVAAAFVDRLLSAADDRGRLRRSVPREGAVEWIVRVMLSLLTVEGPVSRDTAEEAKFLRQFLVPAIFAET